MKNAPIKSTAVLRAKTALAKKRRLLFISLIVVLLLGVLLGFVHQLTQGFQFLFLFFHLAFSLPSIESESSNDNH